MADRGLKRVCSSCGTKFYDFGKLPIICPSCNAEFTGEVKVKTRRTRSSIVADTVKRSDIEKRNSESMDDIEDDEDLVSLEDLEEDEEDDLDIDDIDVDLDEEDDDDLEGLEGDIDVDLDKNND